MGDLTPFTPEIPATVAAIYASYELAQAHEPMRGYLGASIIGHECDRYLWYSFRWCVAPSFDGRMLRLFDTGKREEARFVEELRRIGCQVEDKDDSGNQFACHAVGGHLGGHVDALILGLPEAPKTWHVGEFKTHNDASFNELKKLGVEKAKPMHYAQMQGYMGGLKVERALYLAVNKNTDELYAERVNYDAGTYRTIVRRAERIITAMECPPRLSDRADDWRCKYCSAWALCWGRGETAVPIPCKSCRTCCHATPVVGAPAADTPEPRWTCVKHDGNIASPIEDAAACRHHLLLPSLIVFAEPADAGTDWIEFANAADGAHWRHGNDQEAGHYTTNELRSTGSAAIGNATVSKAKAALAGRITKEQ
jgi:hypothetical protein